MNLRAVISDTEHDVIEGQITAAMPIEVHEEIDGTLPISVEGDQALDHISGHDPLRLAHCSYPPSAAPSSRLAADGPGEWRSGARDKRL